jgi:hypothetical protein
MDAAKGLLDHVDCVGVGGGYRLAFLVGNRSHNPIGRFELVDSVPQRLVLVCIHRVEDNNPRV